MGKRGKTPRKKSGEAVQQCDSNNENWGRDIHEEPRKYLYGRQSAKERERGGSTGGRNMGDGNSLSGLISPGRIPPVAGPKQIRGEPARRGKPNMMREIEFCFEKNGACSWSDKPTSTNGETILLKEKGVNLILGEGGEEGGKKREGGRKPSAPR